MPVISQGDTAQRSDIARKKYGVNGKGVKVGVLSDSYNNLGTAKKGVKQGELPGPGNPFQFHKPVDVLEDLDSGGEDEGRAMLEIVHDVAPGSTLAFHTAFLGEADFAQGIQDLADKGCQVIADDVSYFDEPFFQDGIIAQSVDESKKKGVAYFSSAGNDWLNSYEYAYQSSDVELLGPGAGTAQNFSAAGDPPVYAQPVYIPPGGTLVSSFQWDQSSYTASGVGASSDLDIYLLDIYGNVVKPQVRNTRQYCQRRSNRGVRIRQQYFELHLFYCDFEICRTGSRPPQIYSIRRRSVLRYISGDSWCVIRNLCWPP